MPYAVVHKIIPSIFRIMVHQRRVTGMWPLVRSPRRMLRVVLERTVCQPEKRKVGSSTLPLTTSP